MNVKANWIGYHTLLRKEIIRILRIWQQTILPSLLTAILYFLIFGRVIGERVGTMDGFAYMVYITPGLIALAVITNAYSNVVSSFFGMRFTRAVEELFVSPMPNLLVISGYITAGVFRGILVSIGVSLVALFFGAFHMEHIVIAMLTILLCGILFGLAGFLNSMFAKNFDDVAFVPTFVLTPLIYLGGIFYSVNQLPPFWQFISKLNPIYYVINLFRYAMLNIGGQMEGISIGMLVVFIAILGGLCWYCMARGVGVKS